MNKDWSLYDKLNDIDLGKEEVEEDSIEINDEDEFINLKAKNLADILGIGPVITNQTNSCILHESFDKEIYKDIVSKSNVLKQLIQEGNKKLSTFDILHEDSFLALYKNRPKFISKNKLSPVGLISSNLLRTIVKTQDFVTLRRLCRNNVLNAAVGTQTIAQHIFDLLESWKEDYEQKKSNGSPVEHLPGHSIQMIQDLILQQDNITKHMQNSLTAQMNGDIELSKSEGMNAKQASDLAYIQAKKFSENILKDKTSQNVFQQGIQDSFKEGLLETEETNDLITQWGLEGTSSNTRISLDSKREAIKRLRQSKKLKNFANAIGRLKDLANNSVKKPSLENPLEPNDIKVGNDLANLLPNEYTNLAMKDTKREFYKKYNERSLLEHDKISSNSMGRGPMIVCLDESGSMYGEKEKWSKAIVVGLLEIAQKQKRNFCCIKFSDILGKVFTIEKGELDPNVLLDMVEEFMNGSTNFEKPLREALKQIDNQKFAKADIVFITDGEAGISNNLIYEIKNKKKQKDFSILSMLINTGSNSDASLKLISDKIISVDNLVSDVDNVSKQIFNSMN